MLSWNEFLSGDLGVVDGEMSEVKLFSMFPHFFGVHRREAFTPLQ